MDTSGGDPRTTCDAKPSVVKCVVWDLDDTLWQGTLLEGDAPVLTPGALETVQELDRRGILQSIASRNEHGPAWECVESMGLSRYFLHPQINWASKGESIRRISSILGIATDSFALVDDQPLERDEIRFTMPEVLVIDAVDIGRMLGFPALQPGEVTKESRQRRLMYQADMRRSLAADAFPGTRQEFLTTLDTILTVREARHDDLQRAEELTIRTNQLNTTGRTFSAAELGSLLHSRDHIILVADLEDRYGSSGTIGLVLIEKEPDCWQIRLLIMSCRVLGRGVGDVMLSYILNSAKRSRVRLRAEFVQTERNRIMLVTYRFNGFVTVAEEGEKIVLEHPLGSIRPYPAHVTVR